MSGLFEHIEMFDEGNKVANRQALAVANKRFNDTFAGFLRQASSEKEFNGRLALVEQDIANMAADVANEYGGDAEKIASAIKQSMDPWQVERDRERGKSNNDPDWEKSSDPAKQPPSPTCENCGNHGCEQCDYNSDDYPEAAKIASKDRPEHLKAQDEVQLADEHSQVPPWLKKQIADEDQEDGGNLRNKEAAAHTVKKKGDEFVVVEDGGEEAAGPFDSKEKAQARAKELNDLENLEKEAGFGEATDSDPWADPMDAWGIHNQKSEMNKDYAEKGQFSGHLDFRQLNPEIWNEAINKLVAKHPYLPMEVVEHFKHDADKGKILQGVLNINNIDSIVAAIEKYMGPAAFEKFNKGASVTPAMAKALQLKHAAKPETGDSTEENESLPTGNEDAHDGPSPKIDKKKWKPNATNPDGNLKPIDTEGDKSPHPTRHMDIKDKPDYQQDALENLNKYDNDVWERQTLPNKRDHDSAGFETTRNIQEETKAAETWHDKSTQANPVTKVSLPDALAEKQSAMWDPGRPGRMILDALANEYPDIANALDEAEGGNMQAIRQLVRSGLLQQAQELAFSLHEFDPNNYPQPDIPAEIEQGVAQGDPEAAQEYIRMFREDGGDELDAEATEPEIAPEEEAVEEIIERGDDEGDRVEVIHEHDDEKESDEEESDEFDSFDELDEPTDEQLERLERGEEDPDEWL